jgi:hypothetical protein
VIEDGRVRSEPCNRELLDVTAQCAAGQQAAGDVVQPEALAYFVKFLCRFHDFSPAVGSDVVSLSSSGTQLQPGSAHFDFAVMEVPFPECAFDP